MPIQVPPPKLNGGKLVAIGVVGAVLLIVLAMPRVVRGLFVIVAVLAAGAGWWLAQ